MTSFLPTKRTTLKRAPARGSYDKGVVYNIIDECLVCHVAIIRDGYPMVLPTSIIRRGEFVYIHGGKNSTLMKYILSGAPSCITISHVDALVAARAGFNCAVDYRSVVIFTTDVEEVVDLREKGDILNGFIQHIVPGHVVRPAKDNEVNATSIARIRLSEVSAKSRSVGVKEFDDDYGLDLWAGVIPLRTMKLEPVTCTKGSVVHEVPEAVIHGLQKRIR